MKKFKSKKRKTKLNKSFIFLLFIILFIFVAINNKQLLGSKSFFSYLINDNLNFKDTKINNIEFIMKYALDMDYVETKPKKEQQVSNMVVNKISSTNPPIVYIYNTHQLESYKSSFLESYNISSTVIIASKILKEYLNELGINSIVENKDLIKERNNLGLKYGKSYVISRAALEEAYRANSSLEYFIDIHRDSGLRHNSVVLANNKNYAQTLFVIGLDNPTYKNNLAFANILNEKLNNKVPGISKGVINKSGSDVNGIYNQDFNRNVLLIEIGNESNVIEEVNNTLEILAMVIAEYIKEV